MPRPQGKHPNPDHWLSAEQKAKYARVARARQLYLEASENAWEIAKQRAADEVAGLRYQMEQETLAAYEPTPHAQRPVHGLSLSTLKRAFKTTDTRTVTDILGLWAPELHGKKERGPWFEILWADSQQSTKQCRVRLNDLKIGGTWLEPSHPSKATIYSTDDEWHVQFDDENESLPTLLARALSASTTLNEYTDYETAINEIGRTFLKGEK